MLKNFQSEEQNIDLRLSKVAPMYRIALATSNIPAGFLNILRNINSRFYSPGKFRKGCSGRDDCRS